MHVVKTYGINATEALMGDWEELNKKANVRHVCLQNSFKVYMDVFIKKAKFLKVL